jgi:hypothetical protein
MIGNSAVGIFVESILYISHAAADSHHVEITDAAECRAQVSHRTGTNPAIPDRPVESIQKIMDFYPLYVQYNQCFTQ